MSDPYSSLFPPGDFREVVLWAALRDCTVARPSVRPFVPCGECLIGVPAQSGLAAQHAQVCAPVRAVVTQIDGQVVRRAECSQRQQRNGARAFVITTVISCHHLQRQTRQTTLHDR